jgi:predicted PurR-regulated permease PerM
MGNERLKTAFLILLVVAISAAFVAMIRAFLLTVLLAAIFSAMARPVYLRPEATGGDWRRLEATGGDWRRLEAWTRGRSALASVATIVLLLTLAFAPLAGLVSIVTREAVRVSRNARPWIEAPARFPLPPSLRRRPAPSCSFFIL